MLEGYDISSDPQLKDNEIRCSPFGFLTLAGQLREHDYEFVLDESLEDTDVYLSEKLFEEFKRHLNDILSLTLD